MPKFLAKTLTQVAIENALRSPLGRACALLRLRDWAGRLDEGENPSLTEASRALQEREIQHLNLDWFGRGGNPFWVGAENCGPVVERIVGYGLREATEVALGLRTHESVAAYVEDIATRSGVSAEVATKSLLTSTQSTSVALELEDLPPQRALRRDLPIDVYWICEVPEFESYVSWNDRQVTFIVVTPPVDGEITNLRTDPELLEEGKVTRSAGVVVVQRAPRAVPSEAMNAETPIVALLNEHDHTKVG